jgi:hypothetical protein
MANSAAVKACSDWCTWMPSTLIKAAAAQHFWHGHPDTLHRVCSSEVLEIAKLLFTSK